MDVDDLKPDKDIKKPEIKSWDQMKKEAKQKAKEKYAERLGVKKDVSGTEDKPKPEEIPSTVQDPDRGVSKPEDVASESKTEPKKEEPKIDVDAVAKRAAQEAAKEVAEQSKADKKEFQDKLDQILSKDADIQQKQKDADELIASWDKESRLPKDYKELIDETMRIADAKTAQRQRQIEAKAQAEKPAEAPAAPVDDSQQRLLSYQKEITADLQDLYDGKFLPKPSDINEINNEQTTDEAAKETQKILAFGVKLNTDRVKQGMAPITSLNKIYFMHYKPVMDKAISKSDQPPGVDAPVSPSRNQSVTQPSSNQPFYRKGEDGRYHPKSWAQIKFDMLKSRVSK